MIKHVEQVSGSAYNQQAVAVWLETVQAGFGDGRCSPFNWDDRISVVLSSRGEVQSLIVWRNMQWAKQAFICMGWTAPKMRRKGLYAKLYKAVRAQAKKLGARSLAGTTHPKNTALQQAALKQGRKLVGLVYEEQLQG